MRCIDERVLLRALGQPFRNARLRATLQSTEQLMPGLLNAPAGLQILLNPREQRRCHLGIGQSPVGASCAWQAQVIDDVAKAVAARFRIKTA